MIFKHLLTVWFLVFTLMSSVAGACAGHGDDNHATPAIDASMALDKLLPLQNDSCPDHCCHAAAHVVALIGRACACMTASPLSMGLMLFDTHPNSLPIAPPYHPPIV
jgi:heme O synthase-like polyprenyltransferase